jgi:hypothetical protein
MIRRGEQPRLAFEARAAAAIGGERVRHDFDRHVATDLISRAQWTSPSSDAGV